MRLPRQNQYPKTISIGEETYQVRWVNRFKKDSTQIGECCSSDRIIRIKRGLTPDERLKTFIHEVLHGYECEFEIKLPHKLVYQLEEAIYHFLVSNF